MGVALGNLEVMPTQRMWDRQFPEWISEANSAGEDPNDLGDVAWANDKIDHAFECHYLPHIVEGSIVLELGPGTGRLTRRVLSRCQKMILVDNSKMVCGWLESYLAGKSKYENHYLKQPTIEMLDAESVNVVPAYGIVEHLDLHDLSWYFDEFTRVLKPGGALAFNFDNISSDEGRDWLIEKRRVPQSQIHFSLLLP